MMQMRVSGWGGVAVLVVAVVGGCGDDAEGGACSEVVCGPHAACVTLAEGPTCACETGYVGTAAGCLPDPCAGLACNHGQCAVTADASAVCVCDAGYVAALDGLSCGIASDACAGETCDDHGTCAVAADEAVCVCDAGYVAVADRLGCVEEAAQDPCDPNPCTAPLQTRCVAVGASAVCHCDEGAVVDASGACVVPPADPCDPNPCTAAHRSRCAPEDGAYRCDCDPGYTLGTDGLCATTLVDPCAPNPCATVGQDVCEPQADGSARCLCADGFVSDGSGGCRRPDPCASGPCQDAHRTTCLTGADGAYLCACDEGYEEDAAAQCVPVDPCDPNPCDLPNRGVCTASVNGTAICSCDPGFGDVDGACVDADPCDPNPCIEPHRSQCAAGPDGTSCACDVGYVDNGLACVVESTPECSPFHSAPDAFEPDDCAGSATGIEAPPMSQAHTLDIAGDQDWFSLACGAHDTLAIAVTGADTFTSLYAADGVTVLYGSDSQTVRYRCLDAATPYIRVRAYTSTATGTYTVAFDRIPDDHGDTLADATPLALESPLAFALEGPGDRDVFTYPCVAGHQYALLATNADTVLTAYDAAGTVLVTTDAQTFRWRATSGGTCAVGLTLYTPSGWDSTATVEVRDLGLDDHADTLADASDLPADGAPHDFQLATPGDIDAFAFPCVAGHGYQIALTNADTVAELFDESGVRLYQTDAQTLRLRVAATGTCHLTAKLYTPSGWDDTATVTVTDLGLDDAPSDPAAGLVLSPDGSARAFALDVPGDVDAFRFPVTAHHAYAVAVTNADTRMVVLAPTGETLTNTDSQSFYFFAAVDGTAAVVISLYATSGWDSTATLTLTDLGLDSHGWDPTTATALDLGGAELAGAFEVGGDADWFSFVAVDGHILKLVGLDTGVDYALYGADGTTLLATRTGSTSFVTLAGVGTRFLRLTQDSGYRVPYRLAVTDLGADDFGDDAVGAGTLVVDGQALAGSLEQPGDVDVFAVELAASQAYAVEWTGVTPKIAVYAPDGTKLVESSASPVLFTSAAQAGTSYVWVRHSATSGYGAYTVRVRR